MEYEVEIVSENEFMEGYVTVYYVRHADGGESYEYEIDLWYDNEDLLLVELTHDGYGDAFSALIQAYIDVCVYFLGIADE